MNTFDADGRLAPGQNWFEQFEQKQQERFRPDDFVDAYHKTQRDMAANYSQGYRQSSSTPRPEGWWQSMVLNAVPVLGQGKMFIETLIEKDLATGQRVNPYEHAAWTIAGSAMGAGNFVRAGAYSAAGMSGSMATMGGTMGLRATPVASAGAANVAHNAAQYAKLKEYYRALEAVTESEKTWTRLETVGATPRKNSRTGREVIERLRDEGSIVNDPIKGTLFKASDGEWHPLRYADMSHKTDAVTWWNSTGRGFGAKAPEVRQWMLDPQNYTLDYYKINRSAGAKLGNSGVRYLPPLK